MKKSLATIIGTALMAIIPLTSTNDAYANNPFKGKPHIGIKQKNTSVIPPVLYGQTDVWVDTSGGKRDTYHFEGGWVIGTKYWGVMYTGSDRRKR